MTTWPYRLTIAFVRKLLFPYWQPEIRGLQNLPPEGPVIIAGNHPTVLDGFLLAAALPRRLDFLVSPAALKVPVVGALLKALDVIPADRGNLYEALRRVRAGDWVGIFPEGRNSRSAELWEFHPGVALLAKRTGAAVVPVGTAGSLRCLPAGAPYMKGGPIRMSFGPPLRCGPQEGVEAFLERVRQGICAQVDLPHPPPVRRWDLPFYAARAFWVPLSWLLLKLF